MSGEPIASGKINVTDDCALFYEKYGTGPTKVLLVPGGTGSIRTDMMPLVKSLDRSKVTIIAMDPAGYGRSRPPDRNYDLGPDMYKVDAGNAVKLMEKLGYSEFTWIGWSDGGRTGLVAAALYPASVERLIIWGAAPVVTQRQKLALSASTDMNTWDPVRKESFISEYGLATAQAMWARHTAFYQTLNNLCEELICKIRCPTLILHGRRDPVEEEVVHKLSKQIALCEYHVYPDGGHGIHIEKNADVTRRIHTFIESNEPDAF